MAWTPTWFDGCEAAYHRFVDHTTAFRSGTVPTRSSAEVFLSDYSYLFSASAGTSVVYVPSGDRNGASGSPASSYGTGEAWVSFHMLWSSLPASETSWGHIGAVGTTNSFFRILADGKMRIVIQGGSPETVTSTESISAATWYAVSCRIKNGAPLQIIVRDTSGSQVMSLVTTGNHPGSATGFFSLGVVASGTATWYADNIVASAEAVAGAGNSGDPVVTLGHRYRVGSLYPTGNGFYQQQDPGVGDGDYRDVDESPGDDNTTYVVEATSGQRMTVTHETLHADAGTIYALMAWGLDASQSSSVSMNRQGSYRIGGTDYDSPNRLIANSGGATYYDGHYLLTQNPATSLAWTDSDVDALETGREKVDTASTLRTTAVYLEYLATVPIVSDFIPRTQFLFSLAGLAIPAAMGKILVPTATEIARILT